MVMKPEPLFHAVRAVRSEAARVLLMCPQGAPFNQDTAQRLARESHLVLVCGHYEGIDERVRDALIDEEISIGDYVLTNGVLPAAVVVDAVTRLVPGVLGHADSAGNDSFSGGLLEYPHYTRPPVFEDRAVPEILLSGDHPAIARWRQEKALLRTRQRRPDLLPPEERS